MRRSERPIKREGELLRRLLFKTVSDGAKLCPAVIVAGAVRPTPLLLGIFLAGLAATGCRVSGTATASNDSALTPEYTDGRLTRLNYDRNGDGRDDTWAYMDGAIVSRVEVDEDANGTVDRWEYHRAPTSGSGNGGTTPLIVQGSTPDKTIERIERATRHDGVITRKEFFLEGALVRVEEDTDGDRMVDKWETYEHGELVTMSIDTMKRGKADRRLVYGPNGAFLRIETDPTGSGHFTPLNP